MADTNLIIYALIFSEWRFGDGKVIGPKLSQLSTKLLCFEPVSVETDDQIYRLPSTSLRNQSRRPTQDHHTLNVRREISTS